MTTVVRVLEVLPDEEDVLPSGPVSPRDAVVEAAVNYFDARGRERTLAERALRHAVRRLRTEAAHHNRRESP